jgi:chemotaxis protein MotA
MASTEQTLRAGRQGPASVPESSRRLWQGADRATLLGLGGAFLLVLLAIAMGGSLGAFFDLSSVLIVLGGTVAVTTVSFSLGEMSRVPRLVLQAVVGNHADPSAAALDAIQIADAARRQGHPVLEDTLRKPSIPALQRQAFNMVLDGTQPDEIERSLRRELQATAARHRASVEILRRAAEVAPAMGLIGTLIGLVQMLSTLDKPSGIGPAMAVALLTTFYGAVTANMLLLPVAAKLERNSQQEMLALNIHLLAALSIARQDNPRRLETTLNSALPPARRITYFQ